MTRSVIVGLSFFYRIKIFAALFVARWLTCDNVIINKWQVSSNKGGGILRWRGCPEIAEASAMSRIWEVHYALEGRIARWTEATRVPSSDAAGCIQMHHSCGRIILRGSRAHLPPLARRITPAGNTGWCIPLILNSDAYAGFRRSRASVFGDCEANQLPQLYLADITSAVG